MATDQPTEPGEGTLREEDGIFEGIWLGAMDSFCIASGASVPSLALPAAKEIARRVFAIGTRHGKSVERQNCLHPSLN